MALIGHQSQLAELAGARVGLAVGPSGVGKWVAVKEVAAGLSRAIEEIRDDASVDRVREVEEWLRTQPVIDRTKVALVDFDRLSVAGQNALLKTLEEPPPHARIFGVASKQVLPTVWSRCHVVRFGPLSHQEVSEILQELGQPEMMARELGRISGGSVERALMSEEVVTVRADVISFLSSLAREDHGSIWMTTKRWTDTHTTGLWRWLVEALADRAEVYSEADLRLRHELGAQRTRGLAALMTEMARVDPPTLALELWRRR